jgi:hypothetical protein
MAKGDDQRVQQGIDYNTGQQRANQQQQNQRTQQANDIFYGNPQQQAAVGGPQGQQPQPPQQGGQPAAPGQQPAGQPPAYNSKDPASVDAYLDYMAQQPGVNPSVINDRNYWRQKMLADPDTGGGLGPDANYVKQKMMTPEGAPAGSTGGGGFGGAYGGAGGALGTAMGQQANVMGRYANFADTGGFSPEDLSNIRARALSPQRAVYANAFANLNRQKAIQGGYAPGYQTAVGRMAREQGQGISDAATGAESNIAQMVQQGKLSGMGGMANMYGATPGMANMLGNQALDQGQQQLGQQASGNQMTQTQLDKANAGRGGVMRTIGGVAKIGAAVAGAPYTGGQSLRLLG